MNKRDCNGWVLCPSQRFAGKFYFFNIHSGDAVWSLNELENRTARNNYIQRVDKWLTYPEPDCPPVEDNPWQQKKLNFFQQSPSFGQVSFPKYTHSLTQNMGGNISQNMGNLGQNMGNLGQNMGTMGQNLGSLSQNVSNIGQNMGNIGQNIPSNMPNMVNMSNLPPNMRSPNVPSGMQSMMNMPQNMDHLGPDMQILDCNDSFNRPWNSGIINDWQRNCEPYPYWTEVENTPIQKSVNFDSPIKFNENYNLNILKNNWIQQQRRQIFGQKQNTSFERNFNPNMFSQYRDGKHFQWNVNPMSSRNGSFESNDTLKQCFVNNDDKFFGNNRLLGNERFIQNTDDRFPQHLNNRFVQATYKSEQNLDKYTQNQGNPRVVQNQNYVNANPNQKMPEPSKQFSKLLEGQHVLPTQVKPVKETNIPKFTPFHHSTFSKSVENLNNNDTYKSNQQPKFSLVKSPLFSTPQKVQNYNTFGSQSTEKLSSKNPTRVVQRRASCDSRFGEIGSKEDRKISFDSRFAEASKEDRRGSFDSRFVETASKEDRRGPFDSRLTEIASKEDRRGSFDSRFVDTARGERRGSSDTRFTDTASEDRSLKRPLFYDSFTKDSYTKDSDKKKRVRDCDLRHFLTAKRQKMYDASQKNNGESHTNKSEGKKIKTHYTEETKPKDPKKKVTFNLAGDEFEDTGEQETAPDYDENEPYEEAEIPTEELTITSLRDLGSSDREKWYIAVDAEVLLDEDQFVEQLVLSDPDGQCSLLVPYSVKYAIDAQCVGDCLGRERILAARRTSRRLAAPPEHVTVQTAQAESSSEQLNPILECCLQTMDEGYHVVLITSSPELHDKAIANDIYCYTLQEVKDGTIHRSEVTFKVDKKPDETEPEVPVKHLVFQVSNDYKPSAKENKDQIPVNCARKRLFENVEQPFLGDAVASKNLKSLRSNEENEMYSEISRCIMELNLKEPCEKNRYVSNERNRPFQFQSQNGTNKPFQVQMSQDFQPESEEVDGIHYETNRPFQFRTHNETDKTFQIQMSQNFQPESEQAEIENGIHYKTNRPFQFQKSQNEINNPFIQTAQNETFQIKKSQNFQQESEQTEIENVIQICPETENVNQPVRRHFKSINAYTVGSHLKKFVARSDVVEDRIRTRMDELVCCYSQIMEDVLTDVLMKQKTAMSPPFSLLEAIDGVRELFEGNATVKIIIDKLQGVLANVIGKKGQIEASLSPNDFMTVMGCGLLLVKYLMTILPEPSELTDAETNLETVLQIIEDPSLELHQSQLMQTPVVSRSDLREPPKRRNFVKEQSMVVQYLKSHFSAWQNHDASGEDHDQPNTKVIRTVGKNRNILIDNKKNIFETNAKEKTIIQTKLENIKNSFENSNTEKETGVKLTGAKLLKKLALESTNLPPKMKEIDIEKREKTNSEMLSMIHGMTGKLITQYYDIDTILEKSDCDPKVVNSEVPNPNTSPVLPKPRINIKFGNRSNKENDRAQFDRKNNENSVTNKDAEKSLVLEPKTTKSDENINVKHTEKQQLDLDVLDYSGMDVESCDTSEKSLHIDENGAMFSDSIENTSRSNSLARKQVTSTSNDIPNNHNAQSTPDNDNSSPDNDNSSPDNDNSSPDNGTSYHKNDSYEKTRKNKSIPSENSSPHNKVQNSEQKNHKLNQNKVQNITKEPKHPKLTLKLHRTASNNYQTDNNDSKNPKLSLKNHRSAPNIYQTINNDSKNSKLSLKNHRTASNNYQTDNVSSNHRNSTGNNVSTNHRINTNKSDSEAIVDSTQTIGQLMDMDNDSMQTYMIVKLFLSHLNNSFNSIYEFILLTSEEMRRGMSLDKKTAMHEKAEKTHALLAVIIDKLKMILERESSEVSPLKEIQTKINKQSFKDKRITRYKQVVAKCVEQARILQRCLRSISATEFDGSSATSSVTNVLYTNIFEDQI